MLKPRDPRELTEDLLNRSICSVQVAAVLADHGGIFSWGWNSAGLGLGLHAEVHAIQRANRERLRGATIYVASQRRRNKKVVLSKPCEDCQRLIDKWDLRVFYRLANGEWGEETQT